MNYNNPNDAWIEHLQQQENDLREQQQRNQWMIRAFSRLCAWLIGFVLGIVACLLLSGLTSCTSPRTVQEHHHHHYEADTAAVSAQVDHRLQSWHTEMDSAFRAFTNEYSAQWSANEREQEVISELITETTDSLGRRVRQEQRTISRDITRELQQQEQRLVREYEARLRVAVDSVGSIFQQRFDSLASHQTSDIDHQTSSTPSSIDNRPWYQKLWNRLNEVLIIFLIAAFLWFTKKWWLKLLKLVV